jgi:diaminohydroxyphosphoribosylaminopyrimidine deaminase/5-amino-6-(5-phosphoribosylamino)uracil reductase
MRNCFDQALLAEGDVSPNPLVGAIIVKENNIIAKGHHKKAGQAHAELDAINNATTSIVGATLYCNLEPCCHTNKRTPPCAQRIIKEGISTVVISNLDPNPEVSGSGVKLLMDAGIEVIVGILKEEGQRINEIFFHHIVHSSPFVHLKIAQTLDGKTATHLGESKWITNETSRAHVHQSRLSYDGILIGANTARIDNPSLTIRINDKTKAIKRFVLSLSGVLPADLFLFNDQYKEMTYLIVPENTQTSVKANIIYVPRDSAGNVDVEQMCKILYDEYMVTSLYVEGGSKVHTSFLKSNSFNRVSFYIAPKILGSGNSSIKDLSINKMTDSLELTSVEHIPLGSDICITGLRK